MLPKHGINFSFICLLLLLSGPALSKNTDTSLYYQSRQNFLKGNYAAALNINLKLLQLAESKNDGPLMAFSTIEVARMYYFLRDRRAALGYFFKAEKIIVSQHIDTLMYKFAFNVGVMYTELNVVDSALLYYNKARLALTKYPDNINLSKLNGVIADLYLNNLKNPDLAKPYIEEAEKYAMKANSQDWLAFAFIKYSIYYKLLKQYTPSIKYARRANELYARTGGVESRMYALKVLGDALLYSGSQEAGIYYEELMTLRDSLFRNETARKIADYKAIYETEKKERENKILLQKNKLNNSEIEIKNKTIVALIAIVLLFVILIAWRLNVMAYKKKQKELETSQALQKEKVRISRDLHDNVGGQLSYVLYSLDGINAKTGEQRAEITQHINESVRTVIRNLRETIWAISDEAITLYDFSDKLKVYVREIFRNNPTQVEFKENFTSEQCLNSLVGLNLYRICQEIVNNVFKHAQATELRIVVSATERVTIEIMDNGKGFDPEKTENEGFGLTNLKSRAAEANIQLALKTSPGKGTSYTLIV